MPKKGSRRKCPEYGPLAPVPLPKIAKPKKYPPVPSHAHNRFYRTCAPKKSGIYFIFRRETFLPLYVGKSTNIYNRIAHHHWTKMEDHLVAWVEIEKEELLYAEAYYTYLLRPLLAEKGVGEVQRAKPRGFCSLSTDEKKKAWSE